jgi:hypothetical protein
MIIFVRPRCIASRRLMTLIDGRLDAMKSEVPMTVAVVGEHGEAQRLANSALGRSQLVHVRPGRLPRELRGFIPCAVTLAPGRRVRHAGAMGDDAAVARFIEACGDKRVRQWFNAPDQQQGSGGTSPAAEVPDEVLAGQDGDADAAEEEDQHPDGVQVGLD